MAYDFKKLSDVEVVAEPTESANVLIEENGVIKKTPKTAVGGGSTEWDAVISIDGGYTLNDFSNATYVSGNYSAIKTKINNGEFPNVLIQWYQVYGSSEYYVVAKGRDFSMLVTDNSIQMNMGTGYTNTYMCVYLYSDGTFGA